MADSNADLKNNPGKSSSASRSPGAGSDQTLDQDAPRSLSPGVTQALDAPLHVAFVPGDILASRFRVIRYLARGGMGEVYEAEDTELNERVAVKTARFETVQGSHETERFRREIQLARKVTHPNVCRTFDVFRHTPLPVGGSAVARTEILIVSMEFLAGETLDARLRRVGRLTTADAYPLVVQMVAGLNAAHQVGIVHRDFKTSNVMLVAQSQTSNSPRTVITDFGLAHAQESPGCTLTRPGDIVGTPSYMAPEQIEGGEITPATDIYALGIVIYEMLTGSLPFAADTPLATAMKRLNQPPPSARAIIPDLDEKWDRTIARCLERRPAQRFASANDVAKSLAGQQFASSSVGTTEDPGSAHSSVQNSGSVSADQRLRTSSLPGILVALFVIATLAAGFWFFRNRSAEPAASKTETPAAPSPTRRAVAILGFKNLSANPASNSLGNILADSLWSQLDTDEIRLLPASSVDEMLSNLGVHDASASLTNDQVKAIQKFLGADVLITGTYTAQGAPGAEAIQWNIHLIGTAGNTNLGSVSQPGNENDLNAMAIHAGRVLRQSLEITLSPAEEARLDASLSTNADAMRYFAEARDRLRNFDILAATKSLQKSLDADPKFAQARSMLAEAWSMLGYDSKARDEARKALDLGSDLPAEQRDLITARYFSANHDWDKAIQQYSQLWSQYRDEPRYGLFLAGTQISAGKASAALSTLSEIRALSPPSGTLAQADLLEVSAQTSLADYSQALAAATSAADKANSLGANLLLSRARIQQCAAYLNLGHPDQATPLCDEAKRLNSTVGDRLSTANSANAIANVYYNQGNYAAAAPLYQDALNVAQSIGDKQDEAGATLNLANIKAAQGDHSEAMKLYRQSIDLAQERGDFGDLALAQQSLAFELYSSGDRTASAKMFADALALARKIGDQSIESFILHNQCIVQRNLGELAAASESCRKCVELRRRANDPLGTGQGLTGYADVQFAAGDLSGAERSYNEAIALLDGASAKTDASYARLSLAALQLETGHLSDAEKQARAAATELAREKDLGGESSARTNLARSLLAQNQIPAASTEIQRAVALAQQSGDSGAKIDAAIAAARIEAASNHFDAALTALEASLKSARAAKMLQTEFDVRLALGEIQIASGKSAAGRATLRTLAVDAKSRGFLFTANKASAAANKT
jgi:serine/threonine protein kinase/Tfp pilus assembly protein PilF